jgi:hypothetical protein
MKRYVFSILLILSLFCSPLHPRRGGGRAFIGGFAGSMVGSMVGSAMTRDSGSARRAERESRVTQEKVDQMRFEMQAQKSGFTINLMIFAFFIMFLLLLGMFFVMMRMKKR